MGQNCEKFIDMCLKSVKDADAIVYCDGGSKPELIEHIKGFLDYDDFINVIQNKWDSEDKQMNGKQRNFYLNYLKENYPDDWCLVLDADEVCEDLSKIKDFIQQAEKGIYSVKMRHFIGDLGHEDATQKDHWVFNRLFKISEADSYPLDSHPILKGNQIGGTTCTTIWHLGHLPVEYMHYIVKRYKQHANDSTIHTQDFLKAWRDSHLYGGYKRRPVNPTEIPKVILDNFGIDFDELYFMPRKQMEAKHYRDAIDWKDYFGCNNVLLFGCGFGQRVHTLDKIGVNSVGVELSEYAVKNSLTPFIIKGNIIDFNMKARYDLSVAYDLLEHLEYEDLDKAIDTLKKYAHNILVSIPFKGDPNLEADPTHIIKEDKMWWIDKFESHGLRRIPVPDHFQFKEQLLIFKKVAK